MTPPQIFKGETLECGEVIAEGEPNLHDILRFRAAEALANDLVRQICDVCRLQSVTINDKPIEVIIGQMFGEAVVWEVGGISRLDRSRAGYQRPAAEDGRESARVQRALLGITKVSLAIESFISPRLSTRSPAWSRRPPCAGWRTTCVA